MYRTPAAAIDNLNCGGTRGIIETSLPGDVTARVRRPPAAHSRYCDISYFFFFFPPTVFFSPYFLPRHIFPPYRHSTVFRLLTASTHTRQDHHIPSWRALAKPIVLQLSPPASKILPTRPASRNFHAHFNCIPITFPSSSRSFPCKAIRDDHIPVAYFNIHLGTREEIFFTRTHIYRISHIYSRIFLES